MTNDDEPITRREFEQRFREAERPPVIDPTANVLQLVAAEGRRLDEMRTASDRLNEVRDKHQNDLTDLERRHRLEIRELETKFRDKEREAEKARIDAQRAEDKAAIALATQRGEATASALADRVETAAKTLAAEAGSKEQRVDNRAQNQWTIERVMVVIGFLLGGLYFILNAVRT